MTSLETCRRCVGFFVLLLLVGMLSACATIKTGSHFDETTNFGEYKSFSWIDDEPYISASTAIPVDALSKSMIKAEIKAQPRPIIAATGVGTFPIATITSTTSRSTPTQRERWAWIYSIKSPASLYGTAGPRKRSQIVTAAILARPSKRV